MIRFCVTCHAGTFLVDARNIEQCEAWCRLNYGRRTRFIISEATEYNIEWARAMSKRVHKACITGGRNA